MSCSQDIPVISFIARSGSGKTTLLEKVVSRFKAEGWNLAVIKHDAHSFDMDRPGKDTWRMARAGADVVVISSPEKVALIEKVRTEKTLDELIGMISGVDLILTEGFKTSGRPAIEVSRSEAHPELLPGPVKRLAIASDIHWDTGVPCYHIDDAGSVVDEIKKYVARYRCK